MGQKVSAVRRDGNKGGEVMMNLKEIKELIELVSEKGFTEFEVERQGFRLKIGNGPAATPQVAIVAAPAPISTAAVSAVLPRTEAPLPVAPVARPATDSSASLPKPAPAEDLFYIKSPIVGTFYRAPAPTLPAFVEAGSQVKPETVVCIIEAMKLMNEIQADVAGEVVQILVESGTPVEYDQPLFSIRRA